MIVIGISIMSVLVSFKEDPSITYISQYKQIAVAEMHRTGIPASIKMAQALLESGAGRSSLASKANNHFGIKCGGRWSGGTYYLHDDDYNKKGELIKSCFRHFNSPEHSFVAHSEFLATQNRYSFLFDFDSRDYRAWANGLKKAGYATDKKYPQKLINIIEKYQLYLLDDLLAGEEMNLLAYQEGLNTAKNNKRVQVNDKAYFEYPGAIASNETAGSNSTTRQSRKKNHIQNEETIYHIVGFDESLSDIARFYDLEEKGLRLRNRMPKDAKPLPGEKIFLRKKVHINKRPDYIRNEAADDIAAADDFIF
ncbi:MAG: hypothetical protein HKN09_07625 [Saprospiraceae bacterium]|nr:hypothetical protein [Saprospiraceae bacterium]